MSGQFKSTWKIGKAQDAAKAAAINALETCGQDLKGKSQEEAPVDLGDLKGNCSVSSPEISSNDISVSVGYSLPYALRQHEHPEYVHPKAGKAKYLEDPYKSNSNKYMNFIAKAVKKALGG